MSSRYKNSTFFQIILYLLLLAYIFLLAYSGAKLLETQGVSHILGFLMAFFSITFELSCVDRNTCYSGIIFNILMYYFFTRNTYILIFSNLSIVNSVPWVYILLINNFIIFLASLFFIIKTFKKVKINTTYEKYKYFTIASCLNLLSLFLMFILFVCLF